MPVPKRPDAEWAKALLREAGLRATAARIAVMKRLATVGAPQSHADVVDALHEDGFDQSTLFRCLNELADAGVAARLDLGDQVRRFELTDAE
ncbi:MAG: transcriptional repressor, partial [Planctomycetota bacterium]